MSELFGQMQKNTTDTMTINDSLIITHTDFTTGLTRLYRQCNRKKIQTNGKEEEIRNLCLIFLKISASTHSQRPTSQSETQTLQKKCNLAYLQRRNIL